MGIFEDWRAENPDTNQKAAASIEFLFKTIEKITTEAAAIYTSALTADIMERISELDNVLLAALIGQIASPDSVPTIGSSKFVNSGSLANWRGSANGVASLENGAIPLTQLPELDSALIAIKAIREIIDNLINLPVWNSENRNLTFMARNGSTLAVNIPREDQTLISLPVWNFENRTLTFTAKNGATLDVNFLLENITGNIDFDPETREIIILKTDGTEIRINVSDLVEEYIGSLGTHIQVSIGDNNQIKAVLLANSITKSELSAALLAELVQVSEKGAPNGVATLDENGKIPTIQLPSGTNNEDVVILKNWAIELIDWLSKGQVGPSPELVKNVNVLLVKNNTGLLVKENTVLLAKKFKEEINYDWKFY